MKTRLGVTQALYMQPLLFGLDGRDSPFDLSVDIPAQLAIKLRQRTDDLRCAFLSPIDYARHSGEYQIVPDVAVCSSTRLETIQLFVKSGVSNIATLAVDPSVTSEIVLAKIILLEKFPNLSSSGEPVQFLPLPSNLTAMLAKADAALIVNASPPQAPVTDGFALDLVEEWHDLTGLPYVHGFWVAREGEMGPEHISQLIRAKNDGVGHLEQLAKDFAKSTGMDEQTSVQYLTFFSYVFGEAERESVFEFIRFAFYHGVLPDIPETNFFKVDSPPPAARN